MSEQNIIWIRDAKWQEQKLKSGRERNLKTVKKLQKLLDDTKGGKVPIAHLRTLFKKIKNLSDTI